jgi:hypothetical protein
MAPWVNVFSKLTSHPGLIPWAGPAEKPRQPVGQAEGFSILNQPMGMEFDGENLIKINTYLPHR